MGTQLLFKGAVLLLTGLLVACGGSGGDDGGGGNNPEAPVINSFQVTPGATQAGIPATFSWDVSDANGDTLSCTLDADGDGSVDHTYSDCGSTTTQAHTYNAAGNYTARLSVDDGNGGTATQTASIIITANSAPVFGAALSAMPATVGAGGTVTLAWEVSDADGDTLSCTLDADGDGSDDYTLSDCAGAGSQAHVYATAGTYTATLNVTDGNGGTVTSSTSITATAVAGNNPPVFTSALAASPNPARVGDTVGFGWQVSDADGDTLTCTLDADGDGTVDHTYSDCAGVGTQAHVYSTAGTYTATLRVSDGKGGSVQSTTSVSVTANKVPTFDTPFSATPATLREGDTVTYSWMVSDADGDTLACGLDVDGDGAADHTYSDCASVTSQTHVFSTAGTYTATLTVSDGRGGNITASPVSVTVERNANPVINAGGLAASPNPVERNSPVTFSWNSSDADGDTLTCTLDVDDDGTADYTFTDCAGAASQVHSYPTAGTYMARLRISDDLGGAAESTLSMTVTGSNAAPVIDSLAVTSSPSFTNAPATLVWSVSDVDGDTLTCTLDVDADGVSDYTISDCASNTSQSHTFTSPGSHVVRLGVSDGATAVEQALTVDVLRPLAMGVTLAQAPVIAGERAYFTVNVGNRSPLPVDEVVLSLPVPAGLSFVRSWDAEPDATGCTACGAGTEPAWALGTLAAGETRTIVVNASVDAALVDGTAVTAPFVLSAPGMAGVTVDKSLGVYSAPAAEVLLGASTDPVVPGETFAYRIDVGNIGAAPLGNAQLRLALPAGLSIVAISDGGSDQGGGMVTWDLGGMAVTESRYREVTVTVDSSLLAGEVVAARVELSHDGGLAVDRVAEHALTVSGNALPLVVNIGTTTAPAIADGRLSYTLTVGNTSLQPVNDVSVQLRIPAELSFARTWDAEPDPAGCSACTEGTEPTWALGTLEAGETRTIVLNATVQSVLSGHLIHLPVRVTATGLGDTIDRQKIVPVNNMASAELSLIASTDPVVPGETFSYRLDVGNIGAVALANAQLRLVLPAGLSVGSISDGGIDQGSGVVTWDIGTPAVAESLTREIMVTADSSLPAGEVLAASVILTHDGGLAVDQVAEHALTVSGDVLPLVVAIDTAATPAIADDRLLYTVTVGNTSLQPVNDVTLQLRVPKEISFARAYDAEPDAAGCSTCTNGTEASWVLGTLAAGETRTISVNATVQSVLGGHLIRLPVRIAATGLGDIIDLQKVVAMNNAPSAELSLGASTDPVVPGETFRWLLDLGNTSASALSGVELRASLPPGVSVASVSDGGSDTGTGEVVWSIGSLGVGATLHREILVTADAGLDAGQVLQASARLTHDGGLVVGQVAQHALTVSGNALPLVVEVSTAQGPAVAGERLHYTVTVGNTSPLPVDGVKVQLRVPGELYFLRSADADPDAAGCSACTAGSEANWPLGTLAAGETRTIQVNTTVKSVLSGHLIHLPVRVTATDLGDIVDLPKVVAVGSAPPAVLSLGASSDALVAGESFTWLLDLGNIGASALGGVELRAGLPPGVTVTSISDGGSDTGNGEVVWSIGTLASGASLNRQIGVQADGAVAGETMELTASLRHDGGIEVDGQGEFAVTMAKSGGIAALMDVSIAATPQPVSAGTVLGYTITVTNGYGLPVDDVNVQLRVPAGLSFNRRTGAEPDASGCSTCSAGSEAYWSLGTMSGGETRTITINATVDAAMNNGRLIVFPIRINATGMEDTVIRRQVTAVSN